MAKMAQEPNPADLSPGDSNSRGSEFEPTADMMVHDYDDERTLEEEEALDGDEDSQSELASLQKEQDMPLDDLLVLYGYKEGDEATRSSSSEEILSNQDLTLDKDEIARDLLRESLHPLAGERGKDSSSQSLDDESRTTQERDEDEETDEEEPVGSALRQLVEDEPAHEDSGKTCPSRLLRSVSRQQSDEDEEADLGYIPDDEEWKKMIMVGPEHQADVPSGLSSYGDALPYENEDTLMWDPCQLDEKDVEEYLRQVAAPSPNISLANAASVIASSSHVIDDERALNQLLKCGHNREEALRRWRMNPYPLASTMSLWSEEECRSFECGLRIFGKNFHLIQQYKVRTRSVGELINFYYLWKKTERHDMFANRTRLEKKKYFLNPNTTDHMDRFLDERDSPVPVVAPSAGSGSGSAGNTSRERDRSSSPSIHSLISGDPKRHSRTEFVPIDLPPMSTSDPNHLDEDLAQHLDQDSLQSLVQLAATATDEKEPSSGSVAMQIATSSADTIPVPVPSLVNSLDQKSLKAQTLAQ